MNRMGRKLLVIMLVFALGLSSAVPAQALSIFNLALTPELISDGWLVDNTLELEQDSEGYYVFTITPDMVSSGRVTVNLNRFAALFLREFYNVSSARSTFKLKLVNESGRRLTYSGYNFTTENTLPRTNNIFSETTGVLTNNLNRAFGSAYTAMVPTITGESPYTNLCLPVKGFDGKNINLMIAPLRATNDAMLDFYNKRETYEINLQEMMGFDDELVSRGYSGYANYLRRFYNVSSLYDIPLEDAYNVLGTTNGAQTGVTNWTDNVNNGTDDGRPVPASAVNELTDEFKIWGILGLNMDPKDKVKYPYVPNYYMMETDPEVIQFAYDYLYAHGLRFTLDMKNRPFDTTDSEKGRGGDFGIKAYYNKTAGATDNVNAVMRGVTLRHGASLKLDNVTAGLYVPNAWNQYRLYDFGFSLSFSTTWRPDRDDDDEEDEEEVIITPPGTTPETPPGEGTEPGNGLEPPGGTPNVPDQPKPGESTTTPGVPTGRPTPKTGDDAQLLLWMAALITSLAGAGVMIFMAAKKKRRQEGQK